MFVFLVAKFFESDQITLPFVLPAFFWLRRHLRSATSFNEDEFCKVLKSNLFQPPTFLEEHILVEAEQKLIQSRTNPSYLRPPRLVTSVLDKIKILEGQERSRMTEYTNLARSSFIVYSL